MEKTIQINGIDCKFKTSGALPRIYRTTTGRDIFADMTALDGVDDESALQSGVINTLEDVAYCMALHADPTTTDDVIEWLEQFGTFGLIKELPQILDLWTKEIESTSVPELNNEQ